MRRDLDLIRALMLKLEALPTRPGSARVLRAGTPELEVDGYSYDEISYHLDQIKQSGFIEQGGERPAIGVGFRGLTPVGHDYIDAVRDPEIWHQTKSKAEKVGGWTLGVVKDLARGHRQRRAAKARRALSVIEKASRRAIRTA